MQCLGAIKVEMDEMKLALSCVDSVENCPVQTCEEPPPEADHIFLQINIIAGLLQQMNFALLQVHVTVFQSIKFEIPQGDWQRLPHLEWVESTFLHLG